jgi:AcrR family transcriptional regulator
MPENRLEQLTTSAEKAFMKFGIKALSMMDVATNLGVSKKTLYKFFSGKSHLVQHVIQCHCKASREEMGHLVANAENAVDEIIAITALIQFKIRGMHPSLLFDLEKFHPEAFAFITEHKQKTLRGILLTNLMRGQKEGVYRADFDPNLIISFHMAAIEYFSNPTHVIETGIDLSDVQGEFYRYHIRGIASDRGLEILKSK